ncbi:MAG: hypothetical protein H6835_19100 [Planctomycetes bacterium]|nr:hypothetical protein [Planctomycetota bacterium]
MMTRVTAVLLSVLLAAAVAPAQGPANATPGTAAAQPEPTKAVPLRVGILGASVSDGFRCEWRERRDDGTYRAGFKLADMLPLVCPERELRIENRASSMTFLAPDKTGREAVAAVLASDAQCVFAVDYLFWHCYGNHAPKGQPERAEEGRLESLERGLAELARFEVPVVVGDIPDMSKAVGRMLRATQMPPLESIAAANARIAAWAKEHPNVRVLPVSELIAQLHSEQRVDVAGKPFAATAARPLLQQDLLHATPDGLAAIACLLVDAMRQHAPQLGLPDQVDPAATIVRAREAKLQRVPEQPAEQRKRAG